MHHSGKRYMDQANTRSKQRPAASRVVSRLKKAFSGHVSAISQAVVAETQETAPTTLSATAECSEVPVAILVSRRVGWGDRIAVVGAAQSLGSWQPGLSLPLVWSEGDVWRAEVRLAPGVHEFKCVTIKTNGDLEWELGCNRVIKVPASSPGVLEAVCTWADTGSTTLSLGASAAATNIPCSQDPMLVGTSSCSSDELSAYRTCSSTSTADSSLRSYRLDLLGQTTVSSTGAEEEAHAGRAAGPPLQAYSGDVAGARKLSISDDGVDERQQQGTVCTDLQSGGVESNGELSVCATSHAAGPFASTTSQGASTPGTSIHQAATGSGAPLTADAAAGAGRDQQLPPLPRPPPHKGDRLTAVSLQQAAAAAAACDAGGGSGARGADARQGCPGLQSMSSSPLSGPVSSSTLSMLSPVGTDASGLLPGRATSSSTLSFSSLEVSEAVLDESCGGLSEEGAGLGSLGNTSAVALSEASSRGEAGCAGAAPCTSAPGTGDAAGDLESQLVGRPDAYDELMVVDSELLLLEQQQQLLIQQQAEAAMQAVRHSNSKGNTSTPFIQVIDSPDLAAEADADTQALLDAAAVFGSMPFLPSEDTLPPTALARFAGLGEIREVGDEEEGQADVDPRISAAAGDDDEEEDLDELVEDTGPRSSSSSSCSRLSKDQLPILGLTVNVPSAAATAAAQMDAANQAAAAAPAAAAAAKSHPGYVDGPREVPRAVEGLKLSAAAHIIPHVDKVHTGGEDAYFISTAGHGALGVSDGVSAWAEDGIDPGEYSRTLVQYCAEAFEERTLAAASAINKGAFATKFDPRGILRYAQQCTCKPGSATMVLAAMQPGGLLHVANLGDCGVKVVRDGRVVYETKPQQHDFNLPYQLSHPQLFPDTDTADSADRYQWQVQEGDVIVAASDGLFDNLWDDELVQLLYQGLLGVVPLEAPGSLNRVDSTSSMGSSKAGRKLGLRGKHSRSNSTSQLPSLSSSSNGLPVVAAAAADDTSLEADAARQMPRSRSTSHLNSWGAKQLRSWKNKASGKALQQQQQCSAAELPLTSEGAVADQQQQQQPSRMVAEVSADDIARAAELVAAAAAAHAADKEFKSPWSVAAGRAYGLLARLFAKGGKMDDVTCVVAVVQDASRFQAQSAPAATVASSQASDASAAVGGAHAASSSEPSPSDDSSIRPSLVSEGSGLSAAAIDEIR